MKKSGSKTGNEFFSAIAAGLLGEMLLGCAVPVPAQSGCMKPTFSS